MDPFVFAAVLFAAACHAGWNAVIKVGAEPLTATVLIGFGGGLVALALVPLVGVPAAASWPWLIVSVIFHLGYFIGLIGAYEAGDLGQVYPIARGTAPLLTAALSVIVVGEAIGHLAWAGILVLVAGVLLLSLRGGRDLARFDTLAVGFALFTAATICGYSLVDGLGGRASHNAPAYAAWLFVLDGAMMLAYGVLRRGRILFASVPSQWRSGLAGGALSLIAYGIVIWAMTVAPIALVAALRETGVLFGAVISVVYLKEPLRAVRVLAALMIVAGLVLIRLQ
jgi:drug/metabolite transporter (DMT)-like permease